MEIFFLILKILGWILLGILALLLILLCIPVGFQGKAEAHGKEDISGKVKVTYLFHCIVFLLTYEKKEIAGVLKLFGFIKIPVLSSNDKDENEKKKEKQKKKKEKPEKKDDTEKKNFKEKINELKKKALTVYQDWKNKTERFLKFKNDSRVRETIQWLKPRILKILKSLLPGKLKGHLELGLESPDTTGLISGVAGALSPWTHNQLEFVPRFTEEKLEGNIEIKGFWSLILILVRCLIILLNRNVHYTYKEAKKLWRKENG